MKDLNAAIDYVILHPPESDKPLDPQGLQMQAFFAGISYGRKWRVWPDEVPLEGTVCICMAKGDPVSTHALFRTQTFHNMAFCPFVSDEEKEDGEESTPIFPSAGDLWMELRED